MQNRTHLEKVVFVLNKIHADENAVFRFKWSDLRFKERPSPADIAFITKELKEKHKLLFVVFPQPIDDSDGAVMTEEELKASGGFTMGNEELRSVIAMLDDDPHEVAKFLEAKSKGTLKGTPEN